MFALGGGVRAADLGKHDPHPCGRGGKAPRGREKTSKTNFKKEMFKFFINNHV